MNEKPKREAPRFRTNVKLPEIPEGKVLAKFHGEPVLLSKPTLEDQRFGNSNFTERQVEELKTLEFIRQKIAAETAELTQGLDPTDPSTQALIEAIAKRPYSAIEPVPLNGVLLKPNVPVEIGQAVQV